MGLDARGDVSVVELIVYIPLAFVSVFLVVRHGFKRELGWIYLLLLSIIRVVGAITHIAYETSHNPSTNLHIVYSVMESSGISPLLLASLGFLGTVKEIGFDDEPLLTNVLRLLHIAATVALALNISGGVTEASSTDSLSQIQSGVNLRHIGVIIFLVVFILTALITAYLWMNKRRVMMHRRMLLLAVAASIPFLAVRIVYTFCSAYAPTGIPGVTSGTQSLSAFSPTTGSFAVYLIMSVLMEIAVVAIYVTAGLTLPLQKDYYESSAAGWRPSGEEDGIKLTAPTNVYAVGGRSAGGPSSSFAPQY